MHKRYIQRSSTLVLAFMLVIVLIRVSHPAHAQQGAACDPGVAAGYRNAGAVTDGNNLVCVSNVWQYPSYIMQSTTGSGGSSCSSYTAGAIHYNSTINNIEFCNGTTWNGFLAQQTTSAPTAGAGFFVLTETTYNGNLGGLTGGDAKCLTELTTKTNWYGYSAANAAGQLISGKVKIWLSSASASRALTGSSKYYFARVGDSSSGGGYFYTNSSGYGPYASTAGTVIDTTQWSAANRFNVATVYISNHGVNGCNTSDWVNNSSYPCNGNPPDDCSNYSSSSAAAYTPIGDSTQSSFPRFTDGVAGGTTCDISLRILCSVNP